MPISLPPISRRKFLGTSIAAAVGLAVGPAAGSLGLSAGGVVSPRTSSVDVGRGAGVGFRTTIGLGVTGRRVGV